MFYVKPEGYVRVHGHRGVVPSAHMGPSERVGLCSCELLCMGVHGACVSLEQRLPLSTHGKAGMALAGLGVPETLLSPWLLGQET